MGFPFPYPPYKNILPPDPPTRVQVFLARIRVGHIRTAIGELLSGFWSWPIIGWVIGTLWAFGLVMLGLAFSPMGVKALFAARIFFVAGGVFLTIALFKWVKASQGSVTQKRTERALVSVIVLLVVGGELWLVHWVNKFVVQSVPEAGIKPPAQQPLVSKEPPMGLPVPTPGTSESKSTKTPRKVPSAQPPEQTEFQGHPPVLVIEPEDAMIYSTEDYHGRFQLYNAGTSDVERIEIYENYYLVVSSTPLQLQQLGPFTAVANAVIPTLKAKNRKPFSINYARAYPVLVEARKNGQGGGWIAEVKLTYRRSFDGTLFTMRKVMWILGLRLLVDDTKRPLPGPPPGWPHLTSLVEIGNALGGLSQKESQYEAPSPQPKEGTDVYSPEGLSRMPRPELKLQTDALCAKIRILSKEWTDGWSKNNANSDREMKSAISREEKEAIAVQRSANNEHLINYVASEFRNKYLRDCLSLRLELLRRVGFVTYEGNNKPTGPGFTEPPLPMTPLLLGVSSSTTGADPFKDVADYLEDLANRLLRRNTYP